MIYLDTHVVVWLYAGQVDRISERAQGLIETHDLRISPMVAIELAYLKEVGRITVESAAIIEGLGVSVGLELCALPFERVAIEAIGQAWTRDPFDRIIVAQAVSGAGALVTKDATILTHCPNAIW